MDKHVDLITLINFVYPYVNMF